MDSNCDVDYEYLHLACLALLPACAICTEVGENTGTPKGWSKLHFSSFTLSKVKDPTKDEGTVHWAWQCTQNNWVWPLVHQYEYGARNLASPCQASCHPKQFSFGNFIELWKWGNKFSALVDWFCSLELKGTVLIYTSPKTALGVWLQTSSEFLLSE